MAEESAQEKTEEPTARKLQKAREDGQVARSQELPGAAVMIGAVTTMVLMGGWLITSLTAVFKAGFVFDNKTLLSPDLLPLTFGSQAVQAYLVVVPVFIVTIVLAILASGATGGYLFSLKSIAPQASKITSLEGFKRMFVIKCLPGSPLLRGRSTTHHCTMHAPPAPLEKTTSRTSACLRHSTLLSLCRSPSSCSRSPNAAKFVAPRQLSLSLSFARLN